MTEEVAAHLKEGGVVVKPYDAMLDDVRKVASSGMRLWTDPAKASSSQSVVPCLYLSPKSLPPSTGCRSDAQGGWQYSARLWQNISQMAYLLAEYLPVCYLSRESRQSAFCEEPQYCLRVPDIERKRLKWLHNG